MKTSPIVPARVDFSDAAAPQAPDFGDVYHARAGAFAQARHVFLGGNDLPRRWSGRSRFVVLETGFGLGNNFLATWQAWRDDPDRCDQLIFLSVEKHPLRAEDLRRAHAHSPAPALSRQLLDAWPPLTHNLHPLDFEQGRVRLWLAFGDAQVWLPELVAQVDAFYLDGFAPARNPELWDAALLKQLARLAAPEATAATWSTKPEFRKALGDAGFEVERRPGFAYKPRMTVARYAPRHRPVEAPGRVARAPSAREVLVIGAGLAGAAMALALSRQGLSCTVLEAGETPAGQASGNPGGLFHGTLHAEDGLHARFNRAAAVLTQRAVRACAGDLPWAQWGLLRLERDAQALEAMQALLDRSGLPADYVQALTSAQATALAGVPLDQPAWFFPGGGAVEPRALVNAWLSASGATVRLGVRVARLDRQGDRWQAHDENGTCVAEADAVVICAGTGTAALTRTDAAGSAWPWIEQRGQLSVAGDVPIRLQMPVAGKGYALQLPDGQWCFGASADAGDPDPALRQTDHAQNLARLRQLLPAIAIPETPLAGRVGWRSLVPDRLPLVGAVPAGAPSQRAEQVRFWPRLPGLMVCAGFGSRGLTWATLSAELAAAQLTGAPWPMESSLAEALDPARFGAKAHRRLTN